MDMLEMSSRCPMQGIITSYGFCMSTCEASNIRNRTSGGMTKKYSECYGSSNDCDGEFCKQIVKSGYIMLPQNAIQWSVLAESAFCHLKCQLPYTGLD